MKLAGIFPLCLATQLAAEPLACLDPLITVTGSDLATRELACSAAAEARKTLASCNAILDRAIEFEIVEAFDTDHAACLGLYHCGEDKIEILSPADMAAARDKEGAFELIADEAYWQSIIVHELTHAAYDTIKCPFTSCVATTEYAAYAMQVFSLPPDQQALFGTSVTLRSKPSFDSISMVMLFMAPDRFAKMAWLHFRGREDPCDYMRLIMEGQMFFDREPL